MRSFLVLGSGSWPEVCRWASCCCFRCWMMCVLARDTVTAPRSTATAIPTDGDTKPKLLDCWSVLLRRATFNRTTAATSSQPIARFGHRPPVLIHRRRHAPTSLRSLRSRRPRTRQVARAEPKSGSHTPGRVATASPLSTSWWTERARRVRVHVVVCAGPIRGGLCGEPRISCAATASAPRAFYVTAVAENSNANESAARDPHSMSLSSQSVNRKHTGRMTSRSSALRARTPPGPISEARRSDRVRQRRWQWS